MSSNRSIKVFAPASVSNVGSGYDIMGFAIEQPGDLIEVFINDSGKISIENNSDSHIPEDSSNVVFPAIEKMLDETGSKKGVHVRFISKINPGSGVGSSAASSSGVVFALNELLGLPYAKIDLVRFAMEGEKLVSGEAHADNVAPCILGGFTLVRSYNPLDIIQVPFPSNLICTVVHPEITIRTADSREVVKKNIYVKDAVIQTGNASALIAGLMGSDLDLVGRSVHDVIAEPYRKNLIPGYVEAKKAVMDSGAIAVNISGSGPSVFAFNSTKAEAINTGKIISSEFLSRGINSKTYISPISDIGVRIIS